MKSLLASCSLVVLLAACTDHSTTPTAVPGMMPSASVAVTASSAEEALIATVAGGVVDANRDDTGDAIDDAPLVSATNDDENGRKYLHLEWNIRGMSRVTSARVRLTTFRGSIDEYDTDFYAADADGDGLLQPADFDVAAAPLGVSMPVSGEGGVESTFEFDVTTTLNDAIVAGRTHLMLQGRLPDGSEGRGLQIYSTSPDSRLGAQPTLLFVSANTIPVVTAPATATAAPKTAYAHQASFSDAGAQDGPWAYTVNWGDGSAATSGQQTTQGAIATSHTYAKNGTYTVTMTVTDKDRVSGCATTVVTVTRPKRRRP